MVGERVVSRRGLRSLGRVREGLRRRMRGTTGRADPLASLLPQEARAVVVVAHPSQRGRALRVLSATRAGRRVVVVVGERSPRSTVAGVTVVGVPGGRGLHRELVAAGPLDALVMLRPGGTEAQRRFWARTFLHLRDGGRYVAPLDVVAGASTSLVDYWEGLVATKPGRRRERELARTVASVTTEAGAAVVTRRGSHLVKLREQGAPGLISRRTARLEVTVVERRDGGTLGPNRVNSSWPAWAEHLDDELAYPPAFLRRYDGPVDLYEGMVAVHDGLVLPESFKWHLAPRLPNNRLSELDARWARFRRPPGEPVDLDGAYYYLDHKNVGHYGHLMVEALPKLWGWARAKAEVPDLRLLRRPTARPQYPDPTDEVLHAFGIADQDIVSVTGPVRVTTLFGATPMIHAKHPYHAHPDVRLVWDRLRDGLLQSNPVVPRLSRIFVTRHGGNRPCRNVDAVEELFVSAGFTVVRPELFTRPEQAALFAEAEVVAGFGGTGLFNLVFSTRAPTVIVLNHDSYDARNEHVITAVLGSDVHYFWSRADISHPEGRFSKHAFRSSWEFDMEANAPALRDLLASLDD